jgi:hypothetical protein
MKILILDDTVRRLNVFRFLYEEQGHEVVTVMKYHDCLDQLESYFHWDLLHLDHDLGDFVVDADFYLDGNNKRQFYTGGHIVQELLRKVWLGHPVPKRVIVHSINPQGRAMSDDLNRYGIPTTWEPYVDPGIRIPSRDDGGLEEDENV